MSELETTYIPHLRAQFERGRPILFTGSGFSMAAKNIDGQGLPSGPGLRELIWPICFQVILFSRKLRLSPTSFMISRCEGRVWPVVRASLPHIYGLGGRLARVVRPCAFDALAAGLHPEISTILRQAVARKFSLPRAIRPAFVRHRRVLFEPIPVGTLEFVHLNGTLDESPAGVDVFPRFSMRNG